MKVLSWYNTHQRIDEIKRTGGWGFRGQGSTVSCAGRGYSI